MARHSRSRRLVILVTLLLGSHLKKRELIPNKTTILQVGGSPDRIAALRTGKVDAAILSGPEFLGSGGMGFHVILDLAKTDIEYPFNVLFVTKQFALEKEPPP